MSIRLSTIHPSPRLPPYPSPSLPPTLPPYPSFFSPPVPGNMLSLPLALQLVIGKTMREELGESVAVAFCKNIKCGQLVLVSGRLGATTTCSLVHLFTCSLILLFFCSLILLFSHSLVHLFSYSLILLFSCSLIHLFSYSLILLSLLRLSIPFFELQLQLSLSIVFASLCPSRVSLLYSRRCRSVLLYPLFISFLLTFLSRFPFFRYPFL